MILGLSGKSLSGKDTAADFLVSEMGWNRKSSFSDNLKNICKKIFNLSDIQTRTQEGKKSLIPTITFDRDMHLIPILRELKKSGYTHDARDFNGLLGKKLSSPREILQFVGTDVIRFFYPEYHCISLMQSVSLKEKVVISDVRFPNEAEAILSRGGKLVRLVRLSGVEKRNSNSSRHLSETALDNWKDWDYVLKNNGLELHGFFQEIQIMLTRLGIENAIK